MIKIKKDIIFRLFYFNILFTSLLENNFGIDPDELMVKTVSAGDGRMLKRFKARSRGRAAPRLKRYSHIEVILEGGEL